LLETSPGCLNPQLFFGRRPRAEGLAEFRTSLAGKRLLVTGAAGSIGSALSAQLADARPTGLMLVDSHENSLAHIRRAIGPSRAAFELVDIKDEAAMASLIAAFRPEVIFHLAAYKHVDLGELYPERYIANNVLATWKLSQIAQRAGVERFVYPSSDKAVDPCSIYGATKRAVEILLRSADAPPSPTRFVCIRLVNVIGARGGVFETLIRQASTGNSLTLTHPQMTRYWMTEGEAVRLLGCAASHDTPGPCLALDCGAPVSLLEVARGIWERYSPDGQEFAVSYIGMRPGEKLAEILLADGEAQEPSGVPGIVRVTTAATGAIDTAWLDDEFEQWERLVMAGDREELRRRLTLLVEKAAIEPEVRS
jgi:FlaA1/EpsC-like NDP-sugar epimerase